MARIECLVAGEGQSSLVATGDAWSVTVTASGERLEGLTAGISILESSTETHLGGLMAEMASRRNGLVESEPQKGKRQWVFNFRTNPFHSGRYHVDVRLYSKQSGELVALSKQSVNFDVVFQAEPSNPHKNFIAMGALF